MGPIHWCSQNFGVFDCSEYVARISSQHLSCPVSEFTGHWYSSIYESRRSEKVRIQGLYGVGVNNKQLCSNAKGLLLSAELIDTHELLFGKFDRWWQVIVGIQVSRVYRMCGRFTLQTFVGELVRVFQLIKLPTNLANRWNIAPT